MLNHRAVALLWGVKCTGSSLGNTGCVVDHIVEEHKWNYCVDNLEWKSTAENVFNSNTVLKRKKVLSSFP
jgi:hypothetical protein